MPDFLCCVRRLHFFIPEFMQKRLTLRLFFSFVLAFSLIRILTNYYLAVNPFSSTSIVMVSPSETVPDKMSFAARVSTVF